MLLIIELVIGFVAALLAFINVANNTLGLIFGLALIVTAVNYLLGDLVVLQKMGNGIASLINGILAVIVALLFDLAIAGFQTSLISFLTFGVLIIIAEFIFHNRVTKAGKVSSN